MKPDPEKPHFSILYFYFGAQDDRESLRSATPKSFGVNGIPTCLGTFFFFFACLESVSTNSSPFLSLCWTRQLPAPSRTSARVCVCVCVGRSTRLRACEQQDRQSRHERLRCGRAYPPGAPPHHHTHTQTTRLGIGAAAAVSARTDSVQGSNPSPHEKETFHVADVGRIMTAESQ